MISTIAPSFTVTATASDLTEGDRYTDHLNQTHIVLSVDISAGVTGAGIYIDVEGQGYPEFYLKDQAVALLVCEEVDTEGFETEEGEPRFAEGATVSITGHHDLIATKSLPCGELAEEVTGQTEDGDKFTVVSIEGRGSFTYNLRNEEGRRVWCVEESELVDGEPSSEGNLFRTLTRRYLSTGDCIKSSAEFRTRDAQRRYAAALPSHTAITFEG